MEGSFGRSVDWQQRAQDYFDSMTKLQERSAEHQAMRDKAEERSRDTYAKEQKSIEANNLKDRQIRDLKLDKTKLQRDVEQLCQGLKPGDSSWSDSAGPEVEAQISYLEREMMKHRKEALEAKKLLAEERLAMGKESREWQEEWTQQMAKFHFEASGHSDEVEHHKNSSEESATQLEAEARRVTLLEEQLAKEKSAYIDLKKEAGTTLKFLQKERKLNKGLKEANAALESDAQQAAERLSETQRSQAQAQQSNREQMLEVKVEDLQGQLDETQTLLDVWRDKHDKAVEERAEAVEQLLHGSGAEGPSTMTQLLSSQREVKALQREVKALQAGRAASGQGAAQPNGSGGRWDRQAPAGQAEPGPSAAGAAEDAASLARAAQQARRTRLDGAEAAGAGAGAGDRAGAGGNVEAQLKRAKSLRLRLTETDPRKLRATLNDEVRRTVLDDDIVELSQRRVDTVIQEIIRVMTGRGAEEGRDGAERLSIVAEDMQVPGVEEHVQLLWIELLDVLRDNADLRKVNLVLDHERQQRVNDKEDMLLERLEEDGDGNGASDALSRAASAPVRHRAADRRRGGHDYGPGMQGYVRRCYAECDDQASMKVLLSTELGRLTTSGEISSITPEQWAMRPVPKAEARAWEEE